MCEAAFAVPAYPALPGASRNGATFRQSPSHRTVCRQTRGRELKFWVSCSSPYYCRGTKCLGNKWARKSGVLQHPLQKPFQLPCFLLSKSAQQTVEHLPLAPRSREVRMALPDVLMVSIRLACVTFVTH